MTYQTDTSDILSTLNLYGLSPILKPNAKKILCEISSSKIITTEQITNLLIPSSRKGVMLATTIRVLTDALGKYGISITYDPFPIQLHREEWRQGIVIVPHITTVIQPKTDIVERGRRKTYISQPTEPLGKMATITSMHHKYLNEIRNHTLLSREKEIELITKAQQGDVAAKALVVKHNQRLVASIAFHYSWTETLEPMDLVQEGNMGMLKALERFDPTRGFKFATYATWWITQRIQRAIADFDKIVRVPVHVQEQLRSLRKKVEEALIRIELEGITDTNYHALTAEFQSVYIGERGQASQKEKSRIHMSESFKGQSLDQPVFFNKDEPLTLADFLYDPFALTSEERIDRKMDLVRQAGGIIKLIQFVKALKQGERNESIFFQYYGLKGDRGLTHEAVAKPFDITSERVRQIISKTWKKLKDAGCPITYETIDREMAYLETLEGIVGKKAEFNLETLYKEKEVKPKINERTYVIPETKPKSLLSNSISVIKIVKATADYYSIDESLIYGKSKKRPVTKVRDIVMYVLKHKFRLTSAEIGHKLGGVAAITVWTGATRVKKQVKKDEKFAKEIKQIESLF